MPTPKITLVKKPKLRAKLLRKLLGDHTKWGPHDQVDFALLTGNVSVYFAEVAMYGQYIRIDQRYDYSLCAGYRRADMSEVERIIALAKIGLIHSRK